MYLITTTINNGYGCSCCKSEWSYTNWSEKLPDLDSITELINHSDSYDDGNPVGIKIEDGGTGETIYEYYMELFRSNGRVKGFSSKEDAISEYTLLLGGRDGNR